MKKVITTLTISAIASILVIGALIASPDAYSSKNNDVLDECKCEKPDTLKVRLTVPDGEKETEFRVDIFKKLDDRNNSDKLLFDFPAFEGDEDLTISAFVIGKDKLESNTAFVVYKVVANQDDEEVALLEIHTSCSKTLFITMKVIDVENPDSGYSLEVLDGLKDTVTSIPLFEPNSCEDEKKKSTGTITVKKALTNDNGGTASVEDFTITVTSVEEPNVDFVLVQDMDHPSINVIDVPAGTYTLSETVLDGYTTVLIAGDTGCPSMFNEEFTIKKGKNLSCIIYNDDDGSLGEPGAGVVFRPTSVIITPNTMSSFSIPGGGIVTIDFTEADTIIVTDPEFQETYAENLIVLYTIVDTAFQGEPIQCFSEGLVMDGSSNGFRIVCPDELKAAEYAFNYALIKTIVLPPI